jgi:hypothetical protein
MEVLQRTANRGSLSTGYDIDNSCKFEADNAEVMTHTYDSAPTSQKKMTISMWYKRTEVGSNIGLIEFGNDASGDYFQIRWGRDVYGSLETYGMRFGSTNFSVGNTYGAVRDTSAWYHIVVAIDTTQGTAANRFKVYRNGAELGWSTDNRATITQNQDLALGENGKRVVVGEGAYRYNGYIAEVNYVDGQQLTSTDFGEYDDDSGIWIPKAYTGTYGNNGFYLDYKNSGNLGEDQSGNNHDFTLTNITAADQSTDTPTNNFCTLNPLWTWTQTMGVSDGATKVNNTVTAWGGAKGSIGVNSGKWYWEHGSFSGNDTMFGIQNQAGGGNAQAYLDAYTLAIQANANVIQFTDPSNRTEAFSKTFSISDIWGVALDLDNNTIAFYRNGSIVNSAFSIDGLIGNGEFFPFVAHYGSGLNSRVNFGGYTGISISSAASDANGYGTFEYAPPSGYYALCTKNLAEYG